jgi:hypothetical protein
MDTALPLPEQQQIIARERLQLLSLACYIRGGIVGVFSSFFLIYVLFMFGMTMVPDSAWVAPPPTTSPASGLYSSNPTPAPTPQPQPPPKALFRIMAGIFGFFVLLGWTLGSLTAYAGWCITKRRRKVLIYIVAALNCVFIPYGTLLGIALIIVMSSPAARAEFEGARAS